MACYTRWEDRFGTLHDLIADLPEEKVPRYARLYERVQRSARVDDAMFAVCHLMQSKLRDRKEVQESFIMQVQSPDGVLSAMKRLTFLGPDGAPLRAYQLVDQFLLRAEIMHKVLLECCSKSDVARNEIQVTPAPFYRSCDLLTLRVEYEGSSIH